MAHGHFNPRSHERSDSPCPPAVTLYIYFNPRSHERSDETHQPSGNKYSMIFQSTLPREERPGLLIRILTFSRFQSTLPREERQTLYLQGFADYYFNPRSHERSDGGCKHYDGSGQNFNPRSHERSDKPCKPDASIPGLFQSTLPREERRS